MYVHTTPSMMNDEVERRECRIDGSKAPALTTYVNETPIWVPVLHRMAERHNIQRKFTSFTSHSSNLSSAQNTSIMITSLYRNITPIVNCPRHAIRIASHRITSRTQKKRGICHTQNAARNQTCTVQHSTHQAKPGDRHGTQKAMQGK